MYDPDQIERGIEVLKEAIDEARESAGHKDVIIGTAFRRCSQYLTRQEQELIVNYALRALRSRVIHLRRERRGLELELKRQQESGEA